MNEKKTKMFAGVRVPEWLYRDLIEYSKKHKVSYSHVCRDALKLWLQTSHEPSKEERFIDDIPRRRQKSYHNPLNVVEVSDLYEHGVFLISSWINQL